MELRATAAAAQAAAREAHNAFLREARERAAAALHAEKAERARVRRAAISAGGKKALAAEVERVVLLMQTSGADALKGGPRLPGGPEGLRHAQVLHGPLPRSLLRRRPHNPPRVP
jgi:hypothetical protein